MKIYERIYYHIQCTINIDFVLFSFYLSRRDFLYTNQRSIYLYQIKKWESLKLEDCYYVDDKFLDVIAIEFWVQAYTQW